MKTLVFAIVAMMGLTSVSFAEEQGAAAPAVEQAAAAPAEGAKEMKKAKKKAKKAKKAEHKAEHKAEAAPAEGAAH